MDIFDDDPARHATRRSINTGANWFYWVAILSVTNSLLVYFFGIRNTPIAFAFTQWIDGTTGAPTVEGLTPPLHLLGLIGDLLIAAAFAGFGYFARKGSDLAFVIGMFVYVIDTMLSIGLRDFWGFGFHLIALFFMFKGLLASRHLRENATAM